MTNIKSQQGVMLLEALIGILIFTIGILAMVAMQANAISNVSNAQYRSEASALADEIMSQIQIDRGSDLTLIGVDQYALSGGTTSYAPLSNWLQRVKRLPGAEANPPTIAITTLASGSTGTFGATKVVTVTVRWRAPTATAVSNHIAIGTISGS